MLQRVGVSDEVLLLDSGRTACAFPSSPDNSLPNRRSEPMKRRDLLAATGAALVSVKLAQPAVAQAAAKPLKFIPEGNLQNPDPI
jgi:hypothetical protein